MHVTNLHRLYITMSHIYKNHVDSTTQNKSTRAYRSSTIMHVLVDLLHKTAELN